MRQALGYGPSSSLPPNVRWHIPREAALTMRILMPGPWSLQTSTEIGQLRPRGISPKTKLRTLGQEAIAQLQAALSDTSFASIVNMFGSHDYPNPQPECEVIWTVRRVSFPTSQPIPNTWDPSTWEDIEQVLLDLTQPASYSYIEQRYRPQLIIMAPNPDLLDLLLPLAIRSAAGTVACHVPTAWITAASTDARGPNGVCLQPRYPLLPPPLQT